MTKTAHILWTGGWDSTYRLLQLLSGTYCEIQPHYVVDPVRSSSRNEIETMECLRRAIGRRNPAWEQRVKPPTVMHLDRIPSDPEIDVALAQLRSEEYLGQQYGWLARYVCYAKASGIPQIELCIEATDAAGRRIKHRVRQVPDSDPPNYELPPGDDAVSMLFQCFTFPLIWTDKANMEQDVERWGMWDIMRRTWFCHQPVLGKYACGTCRPCVYVINKGQYWRMGSLGRVRFLLIEKPKRVIPVRIKSYLKTIATGWAKRFIRS